MKGIILSATSDIATQMCKKWSEEGWQLAGTYNSKGKNYELLQELGVDLYASDFSSQSSVEEAAQELQNNFGSWDFLLFATGTQRPVGKFSQVGFEEWAQSIEINFLNQLRMLHALLPFRKSDAEKTVLFFAGGGTNNAVPYYSAYTISKIGLIKMCELLDAEIDDVKFTIIGPGWVKTKIHTATVEVGEEFAGKNFHKTQEKLQSDDCIPVEDVIASFEWVIQQPKTVVGGRNFSTQFDAWGEEALVNALLGDPDMYKLRRFANSAVVRSS